MPALKTVLARSALFCGATAALWMLPPSASAQQPINTPILTSDANFRDLAGPAGGAYGGTGYADATNNGGVMRTGVFYRSMALSNLTYADWMTLSSLHITLDIDLRTPAEISNTTVQPNPMNGHDWAPQGAAWVNVNIFGAQQPPTTLSNVQLYQSFVTNAGEAAAFGAALLDLARASGPAMYHCSFGKDRTGWTSMLLQTIAGVPSATIIRDYLASNNYLGQPAVQQQWLQAGLNQITASYGTMNAYLAQGLGLTQADIYVLRAKIVYYAELPGQSGFSGNAAAGAALLNALQNSPLSGHYTAFNYYLQSAIDAGTLSGAETRVGGQIYADAASYLLREPLWIDDAISPYAVGQELGAGQRRVWVAGSAGTFNSEGGAGTAGSFEHSAGTIIGSTYRIDGQSSATAGIGYNSGTVGSAGATASVNTGVLTIGGRYAIATLEAGPYVLARADAGWVEYQSARPLDNGLGTALGSTSGAIYSGLAGAGYVMRMAPFTVTGQTAFRASGVSLGSFNESGSELALAVNGIDATSPSVLASVELTLEQRQSDGWTIAPSVSLSYERILGDPQVASTATLYGYTVSQYSAYDSPDLIKASFGITAQHDAFIIEARGSAVAGDGAKSSGIGGQLSIRYSF